MTEDIRSTDRWLIPVEESLRLSGLTRTHLFGALAAGRLASRKAGRRTLIEANSLRAYCAALPAGKHGKRAA